jgi:DNA-binding transcriptional MerR regulator/methylmalonyl-CoA mutase cobalamin-binding subunit
MSTIFEFLYKFLKKSFILLYYNILKTYISKFLSKGVDFCEQIVYFYVEIYEQYMNEGRMEHKHQMKIVARRTGLSPHLIRIWERRYQAVTPERTQTGRRLYSEEDIERLILLRQATKAGETISQIANLPREELARLVAASTDLNPAADSPPIIDDNQAEYHLNQGIEMVRNLDSANLEARLLRASVVLGQQVFLEKVLQPLLVKTGDMWSDGSLKVAHEHLASAVIRSLLGSMFVTMRSEDSGPLILTTTPIGQLHEFGALMVSVIASSIGWRTMYLGPNLPTEDIAAAVAQRQASAVAISIVYPPDDPHLELELKKLHRMLGDKTQILVGGRSVRAYEKTLKEIEALVVTDLADLKVKLNNLREEWAGINTAY